MPTSKKPTDKIQKNGELSFAKNISTAILGIKFILAIILIFVAILFNIQSISSGTNRLKVDTFNASGDPNTATSFWIPPDTSEFESLENRELVRYGRDLVSHTAFYLGPRGVVKNISNGLNCQNCHLNAGTKLFGNNLGAVATKYPVVQPRSGTLVSIEERVNGCLERSLNGQRLENESLEMKAFVAYLKWLGKSVDQEKKKDGFGIKSIEFIDRPADPQKGSMVYNKHCYSCHGANGEGLMGENQKEWKYPPVYGNNSYNIGAGLYRISKFASFVKANMPFGASYDKPILTVEEAWDVAAYVNTMAHPQKDISKDWPDISKKPIDHPFGPYSDQFSESQHKYGPYNGMIKK